MKHIHTFENFLNEGVKWKPSRNENVEGFVAKSFPHGKKGDALLSREEFIKKWEARIESWIGVKPNLAAVKEFFTNNGLNFEFVGADGYTYRIYSPGEGPRSKEYHIQKLKK
jgi:hypothetical protein